MAPKRKVEKSRQDVERVKCVKAQKDSSAAAKNGKASLLTIPAELRNRIYELALVEPSGQVNVTKDLKEPGLLSVNRQLRHEARKIWFFHNSFEFFIEDCHARLYGSFLKLTKPLEYEEKKGVQMAMNIVGSGKNWANLLHWCSLVQAPGGRPLGDEDDCDDYVTVIRAAHRVAATHGYTSWEICLDALEGLRWMAGRLHRDWMND